MRKIVFISALCSILSNLCFGAVKAEDCSSMKNAPEEKVDLQRVLELGLCRNPTTAAAYLSVQAARYSKNAAYAPYLPSVDASAYATKNYRNKEWQDTVMGASLSASYLIFDFGKRYADLSNMAAIWKATGFDYDTAVQSFAYDVIAAYYGLLSADAELKASKDLEGVAKSALDMAQKKFNAGAVAKADVLKAETTYAARGLDVQRAAGTREISKGRLLALLSFPQEDIIEIADLPAEFGSATESKSVGELIELAKKQRPDLMSAGESTNAARYRWNSAMLRRLPSISASGSLSYTDTPSNTFNVGQDHINGQIGLRASMPIFAGFAHVYNQRAALANYERAEEQQRARENAAELDVWTAYQNYQTARKVLEQTDTLLKSATESERVVAGMYKVGRATMLDWQVSQAELVSAKKQNIAAKYDLYIRRAALAQSIGELKKELEYEKEN